jgi:hypothetical protein
MSQTGYCNSHPWKVNRPLPYHKVFPLFIVPQKMFKERQTVEQLKGICRTLQCPEPFFVADSLSRA